MAELEHCNVCSSGEISHLGILKPYLDFKTPIYECKSCHCRFAPRDESVYELLHMSSTSSYAGHKKYAAKLKKFFDGGNIDALKSHLSQTEKNRFIIEEIEGLGNDLNILELGCSCGYLTSYAIKAGHNVLGIDVSKSAINEAREIFGDHFATVDEQAIQSKAPYDIIYHVGTIGCVEDPIKFTRDYLKLLKPDGIFAFNCPNVDHCQRLGRMWVPSCLPPDLVTLFSKRIWEEQFSGDAEVSINEISENIARVNLSRWLLKFASKGYLFEDSHKNSGAVMGRILNRIISMLDRWGNTFGTRDVVPAEFGLHVTLRKKSS
jgi:SAM-dependent methyltransferase